jgi:hypothetical protein
MTAIAVEVSHPPAGWLKPEKTSPPRFRAKLALMLLRYPISVVLAAPGFIGR